MLRNVLAQHARTPAFITGGISAAGSGSCGGFRRPAFLKKSDHSSEGHSHGSGHGSSGAAIAFSNLNQVRGIHQSCSLCGKFYESNPRGEYKNEKLHQEADDREVKNWFGLRDGFKDLREEVLLWTKEWKKRVGDDTHLYINPGDKDKIWTFSSKDSLEQWDTLADSDHNEGFSRCELTISPTGKALFHGFVNTTPPKDGRVKYGGFCVMKSKRPIKSFQRKSYHDWSNYTHLIMKVRGDGRQYMLNISTAGYYDITWNDTYHYILFTRGGPYWQYVKIPFSKFVFGSKGRIQDMQDPIPLDEVANFQILACRVDGPFCLEIDWIGLENDIDKPEEFAYETYTVPNFIVGV